MKKSLQALESEIARLQAEAEKLRNQEVQGVIERIRVAIDHYGLTPDQLFSSRGKRKATRPVDLGSANGALAVGVPKYRDPATGKTWTGRGKPPAWIAGATDRAQFEIKGSAPSGLVKKPAGPTRGGVPRYQDPATGKTWTGMGKPPAWIAGEADRSKFEIKGTASGRPAKKAAAASKGGTPKYKDPATGKTWTGVGKAPAWIAGATDRTPFLIASEAGA
jgi:DNA-binding protein H-NS